MPPSRDCGEIYREFVYSEQKPDAVKEQVAGLAEIISVPGTLVGQTRLTNGQQVPVIAPDTRGICNWSLDRLVTAAMDGQEDPLLREELEAFLHLLRTLRSFAASHHHARHAGRHAGGQCAAEHGAQTELCQVRLPFGSHPSQAADLNPDRREIREAA